MLRLSLLWAAMLAASISPAHAQSSVGLPSCQAIYGDVWGEEKSKAPTREIDGSSMTTREELQAAVGSDRMTAKIVKGGDFSGWDLTGFSGSAVCFEKSNLAGARLTGAVLDRSGFIESDLTGADMRGATMAFVMLRDNKLENVDARGADFTSGRFDGGWFNGSVAGWRLDGANMAGFTFDCGITLDDGCPVYYGDGSISAKGANFNNATLHSFGLFDAGLDGAILDKTIIGPAQLPELEKAEFVGNVILRGAGHDISITPDEARLLLAEHRKWKAVAASPSFDCAKASTAVEKEICGEYASDLRAADRQIAALYKEQRAENPNVRQDQLAWLKQRNACATQESSIDCLRQSHSDRIGKLLGMRGETEWLQPGGEALFIDEVLYLPAAFKGSPLYRRIEPALAGASMATVFVRRDEQGLYSIQGETIAANAHMCSLGAQHLYLDRASGWYVSVTDGSSPMPIFRYREGHIEIFESGRPDYEEYPDHGAFMSCGARAAFGEMQRANLEEAVLATFRNEVNTPR